MFEERLRDGTVVRHKVEGYQGYVEGVTRIKELFTEKGHLLNEPRTKQTFQYRIVLEGESIRRIAPVEDIEILEGTVKIVRGKRVISVPASRGEERAQK